MNHFPMNSNRLCEKIICASQIKSETPTDQLTELINLKSINFPILLGAVDSTQRGYALPQWMETILDYYMLHRLIEMGFRIKLIGLRLLLGCELAKPCSFQLFKPVRKFSSEKKVELGFEAGTVLIKLMQDFTHLWVAWLRSINIERNWILISF